MTHQETTVYAGAGQRPATYTVAAAAYLMNHADQGALVVVDDDHRPIALITEADVMRAVAHGADTGQDHISDWMNDEPPTASPDTVVMQALQIMVSTGKRHLPVVSDGWLVGIDGISDLMDAVVHNFRLAAGTVQADAA
jgi:CBS domain-containing protein